MPAPALAAIPILVSFAEAAGIVVSGIATAAGIDKLSNKVEEYIEDNPEQAQKIFAMIMPEQGLANILKNKLDDGDEVSETEEVVESEPGSTKDVVLGAINSPTGSYQDKNATGNYGSKRGRVIRALEDAGKIRKGNDPNYDASKKYQGYKRFIRPKKADGGMAGDKTYHQVRDQFMPMDSESMEYANGGGIGSMMQPKKKKNKTKKPALQGGVDNYLGKQPQVVAPRTWQSSPDKPSTELAYITKAEKDLIIKKNIHGGLEGGPNMGPSGIMSLDSFGDVGGAGASGGDTDTGGGASQGPGTGGGGFSGRNTNTTSARDFDRQNANQRAALQIAERAQANRLGYDERQNITGIDRSNPNYNRSGIFGGKFNPLSMIAGLFGGPLAGLAMRGITGLKGGFKGLTGRMRGINPLTGEPNTQAEYEQALNDRRVESRRDKMQSRIDKGYNSIFGMRTGDITDQQRATLANLNTQTGVSNNLIGGDPTSSRFEGFSPRVGNTNNMPNVNITDSSNITGGMAPNDYDVGNLGIDNNDFSPGSLGQYATADMINEFGNGRLAGNSNEGFVNDPYGTPDQGFVNDPYGTSDQGFVNNPMGTSDQGFVNDPYGTSDQGFVNNPMGTSDQGFVNNPMGTSDQGFVNDPYGTSDQGFQGIGETTAGLPGSNVFAGNYSQNEVSKQLYGEEYDVLDPFTQQKIDSLIEQVGTKSTGELASNNNYDDADFVNKYGYPLTAGLVNNISPTIQSKMTSIGTVPTAGGLRATGDYGNLSSTFNFEDMIKGEASPKFDYQGNFLDGKVNIDGTYQDGSGNINAGYNNNNGFGAGINYDGSSPQIGFNFNKTYSGGNPIEALLNSFRRK